jgi:predicted nucleotidyltransferase
VRRDLITTRYHERVSSYGDEVRERRRRAGMTQRDLATRSGISQPAIASIESGKRVPSTATRSRLDEALQVRPSVLLAAARERLRTVLDLFGVQNPRVFGSVARGEDRVGSDLDLLVTTPPEFDLFDKALLVHALEEALGAPVDRAGRVQVLTTPIEREWNDLAIHPLVVRFIAELQRPDAVTAGTGQAGRLVAEPAPRPQTRRTLLDTDEQPLVAHDHYVGGLDEGCHLLAGLEA